MMIKLTRNLGYLGLLGSISVGLGEFYLHYSSQVLSSVEAFQFFKFVPIPHLKLGHFLVLAGLPLYFAGYLHIYRMLNSGNETLARTVLASGFIAFAVGGVWIGSRGFMGSLVHLQNEMPAQVYSKIISNYKSFLEVLVQILRLVIAFLSIAFAWTILKGGTHYNKIMALFNPILVLLVFLLIGKMVPQIGKYLLPILMNITHFVIFSVSLYQLEIHRQHD